MVRLQKCCCCSLKTGTLVIGYLNLTFVVTSIIGLIAQLSLHSANGHKWHKELTVAVTESLTVILLALLINGLMVYGAHKGRPGYLIAWLLIKFLGLLLSTVLVVLTWGKSLSAHQDGFMYFIIFVLLPLSLVFAWYLYMVVYSYYSELCDGPRHGRLYDKAAYEFSDTQVAIVSEK